MDSYFNYSTDQDAPLDLSLKSNTAFQRENRYEFPVPGVESGYININKTSTVTSTTQEADCFSHKIDRYIMEKIQDMTNTSSEDYNNTSTIGTDMNIDVDENQSTKTLRDLGVGVTEYNECSQTFEWSVTPILETPHVPETVSTYSDFQYKDSENLQISYDFDCKSNLQSCDDKIELAPAIEISKTNDVRMSKPKNAKFRGGPVFGKSMKPPCKCIHQCFKKIDYCERLNVFESFWNLRDKQEQREFILNYTDRRKKNRSRVLTSVRQFTFKYKLPIISNSKTIKVCKKMFLNTLLLNDNMIRTTWDKFSVSNVKAPKSESLQNPKKVDKETLVKSIRDYICLLPPIEIEYFGPHPSLLNFGEMLDISLIFESYIKWFDPEKYIQRASELELKDILLNNVNIDFQILKEIKCNLSDNDILSNDDNRIYSSRNVDNSALYLTSQNYIYMKEKLSSEDNSSHKSTQYIDPRELHIKETYNDNIGLKLSSQFLIRVILNLSETPKETRQIINNCLPSFTQYLHSISNPKHEHEDKIKNNVFVNKPKDTLCICTRKCHNKINYKERTNIQQYFRELGDKQKQLKFIITYTEKLRKKRCVSQSLTNNRNFTFKYKLPLFSRNSTVNVCKLMFLNTLLVSDNTVKTAWENFEEGVNVNKNKRDSVNSEAILRTMAKSVRDHVNSFVPVESHFLGKRSDKLYLDGSLTIHLMFRFYKEWFDYSKYGRRVETERKYRDIVNRNFKLEFHVAKKDQCDQCQVFREFKKPSDEQTAVHLIHTQSIVTVHNKKNNDKLEAIDSNGKIMVAIFDFEKVLTCPYGQDVLLNNKRKLLCFNFTILDLSIKRPICYMWDERMGKNGGDEVSSCLLKFLCSNIQNGVEEFRFWTDNDESRNRVIFSMYRYIVSIYKVNIYHNFHIKDHVQSEVASVESVIEKVSSAKSIFTPEEWKQLVKCSRTNTQEPFTVIDVKPDDFYNFSSYVEDRAWEKDSKGRFIKWREIREMLFSSDNPSKVKFRYEFNQEFECIDFTGNLNYYEISPLYNGTLPLSSLKYRDLMHLCKVGAIPKNYIEFYKSLPHDDDI